MDDEIVGVSNKNGPLHKTVRQASKALLSLNWKTEFKAATLELDYAYFHVLS